ncbi:hypothetical protein L1987_11586 [Smallanthus sonchifolius]|uniref:Uncharacterized protein n=1 Tax=Smallanthus sonchifolius TaxID=185202 RepID=A0ACB9JDM3_9ASTR|nr:hypothetical protein L1987_11586 [Smallanthus sonchifolius]
MPLDMQHKSEVQGSLMLVVGQELVKPFKIALPWFQEVIEWKRPATIIMVIGSSLMIVYKCLKLDLGGRILLDIRLKEVNGLDL